MNGRILWGTLLIVGTLAAFPLGAQDTSGPRRFRARPPKFDRKEVSRVFFDNVFSRLVGTRPHAANSQSGSHIPAPGPMVSEVAGSTSATTDAFSWAGIIGAATIEDEIKALKLNVDRTVTTPSSFAGQGHKVARRDFSLLAVLFAIVDQFDGEVRWKASASLARDSFARTAANLKAGGSVQVYNESKKRKQDLDDLVRGTRLRGTAADAFQWSSVVERSPLMRLLEERLEIHLKSWTNSESEFRSHTEEVVHEAELTAAIATVLLSEGVDDADDEEYRSFAEMLQRGSTALARAAEADDMEAAGRAMTAISRSCVDCHDIYR